MCESHAERCDELQRTLASLGRVVAVWAAGDACEAAARARPSVIVFGEGLAKLRDWAIPRRLRSLAPHVPLILVLDSRRRIGAEQAALFARVVQNADDAREACRALLAERSAS